ncbi:MAG TPA: DUF2780 domain-containing protein [Isosphaeraceae bacterium]|nr:DUF2780 domain-containing protein [Isosphaeraceae bacterium]
MLTMLSEKTGIGQDEVRKGLGALLSALKSHLPAEVFDRIRGVVPDADALIESAPEAASSGGLLGAVAGLASKVFGG